MDVPISSCSRTYCLVRACSWATEPRLLERLLDLLGDPHDKVSGEPTLCDYLAVSTLVKLVVLLSVPLPFFDCFIAYWYCDTIFLNEMLRYKVNWFAG